MEKMEHITDIMQSIREIIKNDFSEKKEFIVDTGLIMFILNFIFEDDTNKN